MLQFLGRLFNVRQGEWTLVLLMQAQIFLIIGVLLVVKPIAGAWYIGTFGADALPFIFVATALLAGLVSWLYARAAKNFSVLGLNLGSLGGSFLLLFLLLVWRKTMGSGPIDAIGLYLWMAIFGLLASSQFWTLANFVFDIRQAKRLFGFIGAGAILGGIVGGYLTSIFARQYGADLLLLYAGLALLPCMFISVYVWNRRPINAPATHTSRGVIAAKSDQQSAWRSINNSRHLQLICAILILSVMVAKLVDYQFSALAVRQYPATDELAAFFGFWLSNFNLIALFLQLFLTQRVLRWLGVSGTLQFLPAGIGLGALFMLVLPGLPAAILSRAADGSFKQSFNRAATELLFLPLSPEVKRKVKTYIDVFIDSLAGGLGGLLLLLLIDWAGLSPSAISWPVLGLIGLWMACIITIRKEYMEAFREQLQELQPPKKKPFIRSYHKELIANFLRVLQKSKLLQEEAELFYVIERAERLQGTEFIQPMSELLQHEAAAVRLRVLQGLYRYDGHQLDEQILELLYDPDHEVRVAACDCLISQELSREAKGIHQTDLRIAISALLDHEDPKVGGPALISLVTETANNQTLRQHWRIKQRFRQRLEMIKASPNDQEDWKIQLIKAAGRVNIPIARDIIRRALSSKRPTIVRHAILAAGQQLHIDWIPLLINKGTMPEFATEAQVALRQYDKRLLTYLHRQLKAGHLSRSELQLIPPTLSLLKNTEAVGLLIDLIENYQSQNFNLHLASLRALGNLSQSDLQLKVPSTISFRWSIRESKLLVDLVEMHQLQNYLLKHDQSRKETNVILKLLSLLEKRTANSLKRIFLTLGLSYTTNDIDAAHLGIVSPDRNLRLQALEYLDNLLESQLKNHLMPALEKYHNWREDSLSPPKQSLTNLLEQERRYYQRILRARDPELRLSSLQQLEQIANEEYQGLLEKQLKSDRPEVRDLAQKILINIKRAASS